MKKTLAIILAILMVVTTIPMVALPASAALAPTATGGCNGNHSGYTQIKLNGGTTHRITKAGNYYINSSIYESTYSPALTIECSGTVTICFNGYDICHTGYGSRVVYLSPNGGELTVNLCDCKGTGEIYHEKGDTGIDFAPGVITLNMYGGTIRDCNSGLSTWSNSTVNMYGGTIKNCSYYGIYQDSNNGKVNIYGGSIINNNEGIRVCSADSVTLTGSPVISGNTNGDLYYRRPNSAVVAKDLSVSSPITIGQDREAAGDYAVVKVDSADMLGSFKYINNTKQLFYNNNQIFVHGDSHSFKDATCAAPKTCTICGATEGVADNTAHATWGEGVLTRPTKTEEGYYTYTCSACGATKTEAAQRAANYAEYTKALNDLRAYLDSDKLTDDVKASVAEWLEIYDSDEAYKFIAGEEETVNLYIEAALYYATEIEAAIQDCLAGNHSGNGEYCDICGAALHICDFTGEWKYDTEKHWKECTCGAKEQIASHEDTLVQAEAKAPTCSAAGYEAYEYCTACDYTTYEELPKEIFHKDADKNNKCDDCSAELAFEINRNGELLYYDNPYIQGFQALYDAAQDGDVITLLRDVYASDIELRKELTYDLNGFNIITASNRKIYIHDNVTFKDSVGGSKIYLEVFVYSPCSFEGCSYYILSIEEAGITLDSILSPCAGYYDYKGNAIDTTGKKSINDVYVIENHTEGDIYNCLGYKCAVCEKYYGEPNPDGHEYTEGVCDLCGYDCPHTETYEVVAKPEHFATQNADGSWSKAVISVACKKCYEILEEKEADRADYTEFDEIMAKICEYLDSGKLIDNAYNGYSSTINNIKNNPYTIGSPFQSVVDSYTESLNRMLSEIEAGIADGSIAKADFTYMTSLFDEINALIDSDPNKLTPDAGGMYRGIYNGYYVPQSKNNNHSQESYNLNGKYYETQLENLLAAIKDGSKLKADYTEIDEAIAEIDRKLADENVTDEAKSGLEEIKADLEEMKNNPLSSKADLAVLEKALEDYEAEVDAGIEDGTAVEVDGEEFVSKMIQEWGKKIEAEGLMDAYIDFVDNDKATEEAIAEEDAIREFAKSLEGSVAENADNIAQLEGMVNELLVHFENCLNGTHNVREYNENSPAKCGENAVEEGTCWFCGEVLEREIEGTALTHSFTKYEVTEEAKCGVEGKEVAYCDNGCGETDEKEIEALKHLFIDYIYNEDATCTADGTKTAICLNGCGETDTVTAEDTMLDHADEDSDGICDDCETEIKDVCPDCGGPAHEETGVSQYICMIITFMKLIFSLVRVLQAVA